MADERTQIEIPTSLVEIVRTMGEGLEAAGVKIKEGEVLRGEKADKYADAVAAALAVLEPLKGQMEHDDFARLASLVGYNIGDVAWIDRAEKAIVRSDALDAAEEEERKAAELRAASEFPLTAEGGLDIEAVPEAVRSMVQNQWDREQALVTREAAAKEFEEAQAAREAELAETEFQADITRSMGEIEGLAGDVELRRSTLVEAKRTNEVVYSNMVELWKQEAAAARALQPEIGSTADVDPGLDSKAQAMRTAEVRMKALMDEDPKVTRADAMVTVFRNDPALYKQHKGITE